MKKNDMEYQRIGENKKMRFEYCNKCQKGECSYLEVSKFIDYINSEFKMDYYLEKCPDAAGDGYACDLVYKDNKSDNTMYVEVKRVKFGFGVVNKSNPIVASQVRGLEYVSDDFKIVYYVNLEYSLYKQVEGEDRVKIASDAYRVIKIYETGEIYYLTAGAWEKSLMYYVTDDMKDADTTITEPTYPDYPDYPDEPSWWDYYNDAEYEEAYAAYENACEAWRADCERMETEYYAACDAWNAKQSRDELRTKLEKGKLEQVWYSLCFYNGTEATVITDEFVTDYDFDYSCASDVPAIIYEVYDQSSLEKVKLSEFESIYDIERMVEAALRSSLKMCIVVNDTTTVVEQKNACNFNINSSGTVVYYIDNIPDEKSYGELYRISITGGVVGKAEVYDSNVEIDCCYFVDNDKIKYYKDCKNGMGELYVNKEKIDYDVVTPDIHEAYSDSDKVIYFTDWNSDKCYGTLKIYQNGESVKVADDVSTFSTVSDGRILYLYDYSLNYYKGELRVWENGKTRKIDDDVVAVIPVYETKYKNIY